MNLPHYQDRLYESQRQRRRYQCDERFRLDRINRTRERRGMPAVQSLADVRLRGVQV